MAIKLTRQGAYGHPAAMRHCMHMSSQSFSLNLYGPTGVVVDRLGEYRYKTTPAFCVCMHIFFFFFFDRSIHLLAFSEKKVVGGVVGARFLRRSNIKLPMMNTHAWNVMLSWDNNK